MRVAFLVERNTYFRTFGPVIDEAMKRGHQVFCFYNYSQPRTGSKGYQFPDINQAPKFKNGQVVSLEFKTENEFVEKVLTNGIHVVVSLNTSESNLALIKELKLRGIYWVALQNGFDTVAISGDYLAVPDKFFIYSWEWLECIFDYLERAGKAQEDNFLAFKNKLQEKVKPVGFWLCEKDALSSQRDIKNKWGIPLDKKVVLLLPFPFGSSLKTFWTGYRYGTRFFSQQNDYNVCLAIRKFCDNNNAVLLVKCRKKDPAKRYLTKMADKVVYDEGFYPSTTMECFSIADICFNFYSTAVIEAIAMSVPNVCIAPETKDWQDIATPLWQMILSKARDFFDFPGASYLRTIPESIANLPKQTLADFSFSKDKQAQYLQKFAHSNIETASLNIILEIEKSIKKE
ncbi:MAG: hypothetical protein V1819_03945 [bacterium]